MTPIDFNKTTWAKDVAREVVRVDPLNNGQMFQISVGGIADGEPVAKNDPRIGLAHRIAAACESAVTNIRTEMLAQPPTPAKNPGGSIDPKIITNRIPAQPSLQSKPNTGTGATPG